MTEKENTYSFEPGIPTPRDFKNLGDVLNSGKLDGASGQTERVWGVHGFPIINGEGEVMLLKGGGVEKYDTTLTSMDLVSYEDEHGIVHSVQLVAVSSGYSAKGEGVVKPQSLHTLTAIEQLRHPDGTTSLGSKPGVLFADEHKHNSRIAYNSHLLDALYVGFGNSESIVEFIDDKQNQRDTSKIDQRLISELRIRESSDLEVSELTADDYWRTRPVLTTEYWREQGILNQEDYDAEIERILAGRELERQRLWEQKSPMGRAAIKFTYMFASKYSRPNDVRDFKGLDIL